MDSGDACTTNIVNVFHVAELQKVVKIVNFMFLYFTTIKKLQKPHFICSTILDIVK